MGDLTTVKIAVLTTSYPRSDGDDAGIFVARLVDSLEAMEISGSVFVPKDGQELYQRSMIFPTTRFGYTFFAKRRLAFGAGIMPNIRRNPATLFQAPGLLFGFVNAVMKSRESFTLVHAQWMVTAIPGAILSILMRVPLVVTARGEDIRLLRSRVVRCILTGFLLRAKVIVAVGESARDEIVQLLPRIAKRTVVIENGVDVVPISSATLKELQLRYSLSANKRYVVCIGSVIPRKRILESIKAFAMLGGESEMLVCGRLSDEIYVEECRAECRAKGIDGRVHFLGAVSPDDIWGILRHAAVFISSSESEGRPNAVLEALAVGVPVVLSEIPAHAALITDSRSGVLFSTTEDATEKLKIIVNARAERREYNQGSNQPVAAHGWRDVALQYVRMYQAAIGCENQ